METVVTGDRTVPESGTYDIDAAASTVRFRMSSFLGLVPVRGDFAVAGGRITVSDSLPASTVDVSLRADTFASGMARRDAHVKSADYLDAATYPDITFAGGGPTVPPAGLATLPGELTVRGVTRPVTVTVDAVDVTDGRLTARASATVDRYAFGVTAGKGMTGRRLKMLIEVRADLRPAGQTSTMG
ncbi:YceI family protein [Streptomyces sp. NPDC059009]|uniref:YceI family protein n=1 Tax=Streptomyces sp. NPDC059009 TaxID=3346694 RepID=UPI0036762266